MRKHPISTAYTLLFDYYGEQHWWPGESTIELLVGAVLTQNTSWTNVESAIRNLKSEGVLRLDALLALDQNQLAELIRPSGYYNLKAKRLKNLLEMIAEKYEGNLDFLFDDELYSARENLLLVKGVGPETADAILLYGGNKPIFVVDTYTHRVFHRHNLLEEETDYEAIQNEFMDNLEHDPKLFNEYHALIVKVAKEFCKKTNPKCVGCPLEHL